MDYAKFIALLKKQSKTKKLGEQERKKLNAWKGDQPQLANQIEKIWDLAGEYKAPLQVNTQQGLDRLRQRMKEEKQTSSTPSGTLIRMKSWYWLAAAAVIGLIFTLPFINNNNLPVYETAMQEVKEVLLPDGSLIVLNENSKLKLDKDFVKGKQRSVTLMGEAHFDIQSDPQNPFKINTKQTSVEVLGTAFILRAYPQEDSTTVEVNEGKVLFDDGNKELSLERNMRGACYHISKKMEKTEDYDLDLPSWYKSRNQVFRNSSLENFFLALEIRYDIELDISEELLSSACPITITIQKDEKLESVIQRLETSFNSKIVKTGKSTYQVNNIVC